ncbi:UxaA family hydrolase [Natronolimnobius sp. AArcel1]|uniref:UxaA family hydrolase n=1 Tax=Natronolimnobius sp. AArcel1 TaxID=1679093 RepID=UPI0013E9EC4F|nr:UxaA family hydrolase [Natronolimnobius sp. AArcel1]NGM70521.1 UxaA family hydrolase [Natronolimnobius sp. AArcel1]
MSTDHADGELEEEASTPDSAGGIRDNVLILPSVICSHIVAERIADQIEGCVAAPHDHGCAQLGHDNALTRETLIALGDHPNIAGTVVVGLGCEHVQSDSVADELSERGVDVAELSIQGVGGTEACVDRGSELAREIRTRASVDTAPTDLDELTVGIVSTDLSESTRTQADPLVGAFADRVIDAGGRVLVAGTERITAHPSAARERFENASTQTPEQTGIDGILEANRGPSRTPRLRADAQSYTFDESTRAWGTAPVDAVLEHGETPSQDTQLGFVSASSRFEEAATALAAAGVHLIIHVTGDGIPTGHPIAPVIKVCANDETLTALGTDIDIDAREATVDDLEETVRSVAAGEQSRAERHGVTSFAIERVGPSM